MSEIHECQECQRAIHYWPKNQCSNKKLEVYILLSMALYLENVRSKSYSPTECKWFKYRPLIKICEVTSAYRDKIRVRDKDGVTTLATNMLTQINNRKMKAQKFETREPFRY